MNILGLAVAAALLVEAQPASPVSVQVSQGESSVTLVHEVVVEAPLDRVWAAISTAEGWRSWAAPNVWSPAGEPRTLETSFSRAARSGDPSTIRNLITRTQGQRLLEFRTVRAPEGFPHAATFYRVTHRFELWPLSASRTRIRLTGIGYPNDDAGQQLAGFFREGNRVSLERLHHFLASGPVDWSQIETQ